MNNKRNIRTPIIYIVLLLTLIAFATYFGNSMINPNGEEIVYSQLLEKVKNNEVDALLYNQQERKVFGVEKGSSRKAENMPRSYDFFTIVTDPIQLQTDLKAIVAKAENLDADRVDLTQYGFSEFKYQKPTDFTLLNFIPYLILVGGVAFLFYVMMRQQGGGNGINSFGKSKARMITNESNKVTFEDVAGADEEKEELSEIVDFLKNPKRFDALGARIPKGVLLMGSPGTGKTLLAKAVAGEAGVPFYSISGSDFVEMFVGVGASRVRDLFTTAKRTAPAIIFIDEIDAVGRQRGAGVGGGHDEREQTLNQLLVEMDGFDPHLGIIVIAATNRPDILDPALLRPGRFDRRVTVHRPDVKGREAILKVHAKDKPLGPDIDLHVLAQRTPGFTGADLENILNEAAILAVRQNKTQINMPEVEEAITRDIAGLEKKNRVISEEDKRLTAYHEAGHALVARQLPGCDNVHEISIIPRGQAGGYTITLPDEDTNYITRNQLLDQITMMLGGRVSEAVYLGEISTGASSDLQRATEIARQMVTQFGMSDKVGPIFLGGDQEVFLGREMGHGQSRAYSEELASVIDDEIKRIMDGAYQKAEEILTHHRAAMDAVVGVLLVKERIMGDEFETICQNLHDYAPKKGAEGESDGASTKDQITE